MSNPFNFPVHVYQEGMDLPKEGTYFLVTGNGLWMHKDTGLVRSFVPVDNISCLPDLNVEAEVESRLPKLPTRLVWRIKEFFRRVVDKYRSEAGTVLYFNKATGDYKVHIPEQYVTHGGVSYRRVGLTHLEDMAGYLRVGTIHSHCDFGAFHSGTDIGDERDFDGLHVTFGHNDRDDFTISASVVVNGHRMKIDPETVLDGIALVRGEENIRGHVEDAVYKLAAVESDVKADWSKDLDDWMEQVSPGYGPSVSRNQGRWGFTPNLMMKAGTKVVWGREMTNAGLKAILGDGPFEVAELAEGKKIVIETKVGRAKLSEHLFEKVNQLS